MSNTTTFRAWGVGAAAHGNRSSGRSAPTNPYTFSRNRRTAARDSAPRCTSDPKHTAAASYISRAVGSPQAKWSHATSSVMR